MLSSHSSTLIKQALEKKPAPVLMSPPSQTITTPTLATAVTPSAEAKEIKAEEKASEVKLNDNAYSPAVMYGFSVNFEIPYTDIKFKEVLAISSTATVYSATCKEMPVAVKNFKKTLRNLKDRFYAECETMKNLQRLQLPTVGYVGNIFHKASGTYNLVMDHLPKGDGFDYIFNESWSLGGAIMLLKNTASAYKAMHANHYIHIDVKWSNILLKNDYQVVIADHQTTLQLPPGQPCVQLTEIRGTYGYRAPESILKNRYGPESDVYSFGCMIYEMLEKRDIVSTDLEINKALLPTEEMLLTNVEPLSTTHPPVLISLFNRCRKTDFKERPTFVQIESELEELTRTYKPS